MEPVVLDIFTSSTTSGERKKVFSPGDSLKWTAIHTVRDGSFLGRPFKILWVLDYWAHLGAQVEGPHFDALFKPMVLFSGDFTYRWETMGNFMWYDRIPRMDVITPFTYTDRRDSLDRLARGENMVFGPGIWKLTVHIRMTEASTGRPFGTKSDWYYSIMP